MKTLINKRSTTLLFLCFFVLVSLGSAVPSPALAQCLASCPEGQVPTGNCPIDPGCDPSAASCPQGVYCSRAARTSTSRSRSSTRPTLPPINPFCFTKDECNPGRHASYGVASSFEVPECRAQHEEYVKAGYLYYCYANQPVIPLQVSIGGYKVQGLSEYIKRLYIYLVSIAGIVAGIMIVWAGVKWLTSAGIPDRITDSKKKIANAIVGLILVFGSYVIMQTINPSLVSFRVPPIKVPRQELLGVDRCVKRPEFGCGVRTKCDELRFIRAGNPPCPTGVGPGECIGQHCSGSNDCSRLNQAKVLSISDAGRGRDLAIGYEALMSNLLHLADLNRDQIGDRIGISGEDAEDYIEHAARSYDIDGGEAWACINKNLCSNCGALTPSGVIPPPSEDLQKLVTCISTACHCIVAYTGSPDNPDGEVVPNCQERLTTPTTEEAADVAIPCNRDEQCASRVCNTAINICGPSPSDEESATRCNRDQECSSRQCNTEITVARGGEGRCQEALSQPACAECDSNGVCASNICGTDDECAGMPGEEYSTDDDGDGEYCD